MTHDSRLYICLGCHLPQQAPLAGGSVRCPQCGASQGVGDRLAQPHAVSALQMPVDDAVHLASLRAQQAQLPHGLTTSLSTALQGSSVQTGHEQEAFRIWSLLYGRTTQGDVAASDDLATLTLLLLDAPSVAPQAALCEALLETAYDAVLLPRQKQMMVGRLARAAIGRGDRAIAVRYLGWMMGRAPEVETDSEARVSAAALATLDADPRRVLALLGAENPAVPIAAHLSPLAVVLRANALERLGDLPGAARALGELPDADLVPRVSGSMPALRLCAQAGPAFVAARTQDAAGDAGTNAMVPGCLVGAGLFVAGVAQVPFAWRLHSRFNAVLGAALVAASVLVLVLFIARGRRVASIRSKGLRLVGRVLRVERTGTRINSMPVWRLVIEVAGPQGPYEAALTRCLPEHVAATLIGSEIRVRANPSDIYEIMAEE